MAGYRCYFFARDGHIQNRIEYEADTDEVAISEARAHYAGSEFRDGFEVWEQARLVYQEDRVSQSP